MDDPISELPLVMPAFPDAPPIVPEPPRRRGRLALILALSGAFAEPEPPRLTAAQLEVIEGEVDERAELLAQLDEQRALYASRRDDWTTTLAWTEELHATNTAPTPAVANPGGSAMPGGDPYGRAFLDSIGATDVTVVFEAGPENCGYNLGEHFADYIYAGGCYDNTYSNTLFMAWDPGAEDMVWSIFVHEAMHWFQDENYIQDVYLADLAGVADYDERWEADASCRAVYVYGIPMQEYVDSSSPCTIDGWYEGFIADHLASLGANLGEPDPATFEVTESSRP